MAKGGKIAQIDEILSSTDDSKKYRKLANIRGKLLHKIRLNDNDVKYLEDNGIDTYSFAKGGKTWVQDVVDSPNFREGAFTRKAEARGMSTDAFMNQVLHSPNLYDERTRKQAQFMKNAFND